MKRLWRYLEGHRLLAFLLVLVATGNAAPSTTKPLASTLPCRRFAAPRNS